VIAEPPQPDMLGNTSVCICRHYNKIILHTPKSFVWKYSEAPILAGKKMYWGNSANSHMIYLIYVPHIQGSSHFLKQLQTDHPSVGSSVVIVWISNDEITCISRDPQGSLRGSSYSWQIFSYGGHWHKIFINGCLWPTTYQFGVLDKNIFENH